VECTSLRGHLPGGNGPRGWHFQKYRGVGGDVFGAFDFSEVYRQNHAATEEIGYDALSDESIVYTDH